MTCVGGFVRVCDILLRPSGARVNELAHPTTQGLRPGLRSTFRPSPVPKRLQGWRWQRVSSPEGRQNSAQGASPGNKESPAAEKIMSPGGAPEFSPGRKPWEPEGVRVERSLSPGGAPEFSPGRKPWEPEGARVERSLSPGGAKDETARSRRTGSPLGRRGSLPMLRMARRMGQSGTVGGPN